MSLPQSKVKTEKIKALVVGNSHDARLGRMYGQSRLGTPPLYLSKGSHRLLLVLALHNHIICISRHLKSTFAHVVVERIQVYVR
jgi:hypothetical protein